MMTLVPMRSHSSVTTANLRAVAPARRNAVVVQVYGEAHSGACRDFVLHQLQPVYHVLGAGPASPQPAMMNVEFVPFGRTQIILRHSNSNNDHENFLSSSMECTHGPLECDVHSYMQCAQKLYPTAARHWPFMVCLFERLQHKQQQEESSSRETIENSVLVEEKEEKEKNVDVDNEETLSWRSVIAECAHSAQLDWPSLQNCHDNVDVTWQLQLEAAAQTAERRQQDHSNGEDDPLPWIWIDGLRYDYHSYNEKEEEEDPAGVEQEGAMNRLLPVVCAAHHTRTNRLHPACPAMATTVVSTTRTLSDNDAHLNGVLSPL